jgi:hypothetical protein
MNRGIRFDSMIRASLLVVKCHGSIHIVEDLRRKKERESEQIRTPARMHENPSGEGRTLLTRRLVHSLLTHELEPSSLFE